MKTEIVQLLKEADGYISGQQICEQFHVSRTAVWKVMEQLKKEGYSIEAVRNRGYRLVASPDVLSEAEIASLLKDGRAGSKIVCFKETDSTNLQAKAAGEAGGEDGTLFVAEEQTSGRGRRGRAWSSPSGTSIYMTLLLRPEIPPEKASMLTLVMGLSVAQGLTDACGVSPQIKWPNDILLDKKKVCGILTEMSTEIDYINYVVIGVGINVNQTSFPKEIKDTATSLALQTGRTFSRAEIIAAVLHRFEENEAVFLASGDLTGLMDRYNQLLVHRDEDVLILEPDGSYKAHAQGINEKGELLVQLRDGTEKEIFAGEVSIRGGDTYV